jgi:hypothetical protein
MAWLEQLNGDPLKWLLEIDTPDVRYLALRDLLDCPKNDPELRLASRQAHTEGPIASVLKGMDKTGYWIEPGAGYNPKYRSTVWAMILLAQLGGSIEADPLIGVACKYLLDNALAVGGLFSTNGLTSGTIDCLAGNLAASLLDLGCEDKRLEMAFDWMARFVTGEGIALASDRHAPIRYYAGKCGPNFACGANNKLPCAWGAVKVMLAFGKLPQERRTPIIQRAIQQGVDFLFSVDPAEAAYPSGWSDKPSGNWWKFGFPVFYVTDLLQLVEALVSLGYGRDEQLQPALALICEKQDGSGRWALEYDYTGKSWADFGAKKQPNPWVTLRALKVLKSADAG